MKVVKVKTYQFRELSEEGKQKAIEDNRDINFDFKWYEHIYSDAKSNGLKINSFDLDQNRHAQGHFILNALEVAQNIINEHGPECETHKTAQSFLKEHSPLFSDYLNPDSKNYESSEIEAKLMNLEDEFLKEILKDYANLLQREYEYLSSDEAIQETIQANEYNFLECGKMFNA